MSEQDVTRITDHIDQKLEHNDQTLKLYAEMDAAEKISPSALLKDIAYGVSNFDKFDRVAVVGDETALGSIAGVVGSLTPGLKTKTFGRDEKQRAMAWLTAA